MWEIRLCFIPPSCLKPRHPSPGDAAMCATCQTHWITSLHMSHTYVPANCCFCYLWSISKTNVEVLTQLKCVFCLKNPGFNYYTFYIEVTGALVFTTPLLNHLSPDWLSFINWRFKEQGVGLNVHIRDIHSQWFTHSKSINTSLSIWSSLLTTGSQGLHLHALTSLLEALAMFNMSIWHWNMCSHSLIWFVSGTKSTSPEETPFSLMCAGVA